MPLLVKLLLTDVFVCVITFVLGFSARIDAEHQRADMYERITKTTAAIAMLFVFAFIWTA